MENKNDYEFVDLGLSVKWATCNLGANTPYEYGNYYMWGSTTEGGDQKCTDSEFNRLNLNEITDDLTNEHDVAYQATNGNGRMPTKEEFQELIDKTEHDWRIYTVEDEKQQPYRVKGIEFSSKTNDNKIFIPASGYRDGQTILDAGCYADLWTSTHYDRYFAWNFGFLFGYSCNVSNDGNRYGLCVRAVQYNDSDE